MIKKKQLWPVECSKITEETAYLNDIAQKHRHFFLIKGLEETPLNQTKHCTSHKRKSTMHFC